MRLRSYPPWKSRKNLFFRGSKSYARPRGLPKCLKTCTLFPVICKFTFPAGLCNKRALEFPLGKFIVFFLSALLPRSLPPAHCNQQHWYPIFIFHSSCGCSLSPCLFLTALFSLSPSRSQAVPPLVLTTVSYFLRSSDFSVVHSHCACVLHAAMYVLRIFLATAQFYFEFAIKPSRIAWSVRCIFHLFKHEHTEAQLNGKLLTMHEFLKK